MGGVFCFASHFSTTRAFKLATKTYNNIDRCFKTGKTKKLKVDFFSLFSCRYFDRPLGNGSHFWGVQRVLSTGKRTLLCPMVEFCYHFNAPVLSPGGIVLAPGILSISGWWTHTFTEVCRQEHHERFGFPFLATVQQVNKLVDLTRCAIIGKLDEGTDLLNCFIILLKLHIWVSRNRVYILTLTYSRKK